MACARTHDTWYTFWLLDSRFSVRDPARFSVVLAFRWPESTESMVPGVPQSSPVQPGHLPRKLDIDLRRRGRAAPALDQPVLQHPSITMPLQNSPDPFGWCYRTPSPLPPSHGKKVKSRAEMRGGTVKRQVGYLVRGCFIRYDRSALGIGCRPSVLGVRRCQPESNQG